MKKDYKKVLQECFEIIDFFTLEEQMDRLQQQGFIVVKKEEIEKYKIINFEEPIYNLVEKIYDVMFSRFKEKAKTYFRQEFIYSEKEIKSSIKSLIENFMEVVYDYKPAHKKIWSGKALKENTLKAIKRYKVFELFKKKDNELLYINTQLFLNRKKAEFFLKELSQQSKENYVLKERKII